MKTLNTITLTAAYLFSANIIAADKPQIYDKGMDFDTRYYSVACPDGNMASVTIRFNINEADIEPVNQDVQRARVNPRPVAPKIVEVCAYPVSDRDKVCQAGMDLQNAAIIACK